MQKENNQTDDSSSSQDNTPKVTGIGGIFFFFDDPKKQPNDTLITQNLRATYEGANFESRNTNRPDEINYL